ncbi:hypothetical protein GOL41_26935 [Sinorhizobium medicae]|nr:hypothetical protein [Sinorhizobium meliloti]MDX1053351.1 hypothetical protein [Sinorhizobium medicae]
MATFLVTALVHASNMLEPVRRFYLALLDPLRSKSCGLDEVRQALLAVEAGSLRFPQPQIREANRPAHRISALNGFEPTTIGHPAGKSLRSDLEQLAGRFQSLRVARLCCVET